MKVSIIGGGIIGLTTAFEANLAGHEVTIFDPTPASGATHYAGGMLAPAAEVQFQQDALFPLMSHAAKLWPSLIERISDFTDLPLGYQRQGTIVVAADRADAQHLCQLKKVQDAAGMQVEAITIRQARQLEPALHPNLAAAVHIPGDHQVAPRIFAAALLDALKSQGVVIHQEKAEALPAGGQVVLCNGIEGADNKLCPINLALRPVRGDILRVRLPHPLITKVVRGWVQDRPIYLIPRAHGELAIGATSREDSATHPPLESVYGLLRDALRVLPGLGEAELIEAATGIRPGTPDDLPYLGRINDRLILSNGYFRHGILLAPLAAAATLALLEDREPDIDLAACAPFRHHSRSL